MRLPRVRFTLRQMMFAVAGSGVALACIGMGSTKLGCGSASVLLTFHVVCFAWVFFRARSFSEALALLRALVGYNGIVLPAPFARFIPSESPSLTYEPNVSAVLGHIGGSIYTFLWVLGGLMLALTVRDVDDLAKRFTTTWVSAILTGLLAAFTILSMTRPTEFLYFRF